MKKQLITLFVLLSTALLANAQSEYRLARSTGQLKLNINSDVIIEGYDGKEIIFSGQNIETGEVDERAKGLLALSTSGYTDNTGLGISVTVNGQDVNARLVSKKPIGTLTIKVPQDMKISFINTNNTLFSNNNNSNFHSELILKNLKNEIEVSTYDHKIKIENNTGPMNIKTVRGGIDAIFNSDIKGPVSIISVYDYVDITLPASTKANIELGTNYGKVYAGKEFNIDIDKNEVEKSPTAIAGIATTSGSGNTNNKVTGLTSTKQRGEQITGTGSSAMTITYQSGNFDSLSSFGFQYSMGEKIKGKLNGGGIDLIFKSTNKNVYLRQK